ncbi:MAG: hypothetical protein HYV60_01285 [Planctomycetia bacterium]|nr:hypothetical protein [Planctomycetia bacterium]
MSIDWKALDQEILSQLDIAREAELLGIRFSSRKPSAKGWLDCYAIDRDEQNASAAVNVASTNGQLGKYADQGSTDKSISFFELAARTKTFTDFREARLHYAKQVGVELPSSSSKSKPQTEPSELALDQLLTLSSDKRMRQLASAKKGITVDSLKRARAVDGRWNKKAPVDSQFDVVAIPAYRPPNYQKPTAGVLFRADDKLFPAVPKFGLKERKVHNLRGSVDSLVIVGTAEELEAAQVVWIQESPSSTLSLAPHLPAGHIAVSNTSGAGSFDASLAEVGRDKDVVIVADADTAGVNGAKIRAAACFPVARSVRIATLPYEVKEKHGKDVRDLVTENRVNELFESAKSIAPLTQADIDAFEKERDEKSKSKQAAIENSVPTLAGEDGQPGAIPRPMRDIIAGIKSKTGDWPRRVGCSLFIAQDGRVDWLESTSSLFGYLHSIGDDGVTGVQWKRGDGYVTKEELFAELRRTSQSFRAIEELPHEPPIDGHHYLCPALEPGNGEHLTELLDRFEPAGTRPGYIVTSDSGRGAGKSTVAAMIGQLFGGILSFSQNEDIGKIKTRLLSPDALTKRVCLLDNVKSHKFSWGDLEALITSPTIGGHRMYAGEATRPNTLVWFITLNGASLSTDMAQRAVIVKVNRPTRSASWEEDTRRFIADKQLDIIADIIGALRADPYQLAQFTRWATWEKDILQRLPDPAETQRVILERQAAVDVEADEAGLTQEYFADQLRQLGYDSAFDQVFIPSGIVARWWNWCNNESAKTTAVSRALGQLVDEGRLPQLKRNLTKARGRGFVWEGAKADLDECVKTDIENRISELMKSKESKF